jgi:hypothetical protein
MSNVRVVLNDTGVWCDPGRGVVEGVRWDELVEAFVQTTSDEPTRDGVFIVFVGKDQTSCVVPLGAAPADFVDRVARLPGCDSDVFVHALRSPSKVKLVFWGR